MVKAEELFQSGRRTLNEGEAEGGLLGRYYAFLHEAPRNPKIPYREARMITSWTAKRR